MLAGVLQSFWGIFVCQLKQARSGLISLLSCLLAAENGTNNDLCITSYLPGPMDRPFSAPLDVFLVVGRHVLLNGAVVVESSVQSGMREDLVSFVEHFAVALVIRTFTLLRIHRPG